MNLAAWLKFEPAYLEAAVLHFHNFAILIKT